MIKVCPVGSALRHTPFHCSSDASSQGARDSWSEMTASEKLQQQGVEFVDEANADVIVGGTLKGLAKSLLRYGSRKRYLVWTLESRSNRCFEAQKRYPLLPPVDIFNLYGSPFENNVFEFPLSEQPNSQLLMPLRYFHGFEDRPQERRIVSLMDYQAGRRWRLPYQDRDLDLCNLRTEIAIAAHRQNRIDIYGAGWPKGMAKLVYPQGDRLGQNAEAALLGNYHFNLCFEDTNWPHYCSDQIWRAIQGGCLPIYYGEGNRIYDDFPSDSFVDYAKLGSPEALFWFLDEMLPQEFLERYNRCVAVYNLALERFYTTDCQEQLLKKTFARLQEMMA